MYLLRQVLLANSVCGNLRILVDLLYIMGLVHVLATLSRRLLQLNAIEVLFTLLLIWIRLQIFEAFQQFLRLLDRVEVVVFDFYEFLICWALER